VRDRAEYLTDLDERRRVVLTSIDEQGKLTPALEARIGAAATTAELEDRYRPYKPKRRTRASMATERGLRPLADLLEGGRTSASDLGAAAAGFVDAEGGVPSVDEALAGARDIVAERVADDAGARAMVRDLTRERGVLESRAARGRE